MPYSDNNGCPGGGTNHNLVIKTPSNHSFARDPTTLLKIQPIIIFLFRCASIFRLYPCDSVTRSAEFQISGFCVITIHQDQASPPPSPPGGWPPTKEEVVSYHRMMSKENQRCLCEFKIRIPAQKKVSFVGSKSQCGTISRSAIQRRRIGSRKPSLCTRSFDTEAWRI